MPFFHQPRFNATISVLDVCSCCLLTSPLLFQVTHTSFSTELAEGSSWSENQASPLLNTGHSVPQRSLPPAVATKSVVTSVYILSSNPSCTLAFLASCYSGSCLRNLWLFCLSAVFPCSLHEFIFLFLVSDKCPLPWDISLCLHVSVPTLPVSNRSSSCALSPHRHLSMPCAIIHIDVVSDSDYFLCWEINLIRAGSALFALLLNL